MIFNFLIGLLKLVVDFVRGIPVIKDILNFRLSGILRLPPVTGGVVTTLIGLYVGVRGFVAIRGLIRKVA